MREIGIIVHSWTFFQMSIANLFILFFCQSSKDRRKDVSHPRVTALWKSLKFLLSCPSDHCKGFKVLSNPYSCLKTFFSDMRASTLSLRKVNPFLVKFSFSTLRSFPGISPLSFLPSSFPIILLTDPQENSFKISPLEWGPVHRAPTFRISQMLNSITYEGQAEQCSSDFVCTLSSQNILYFHKETCLFFLETYRP